jgi:holliday junction DNA helicase RuvA
MIAYLKGEFVLKSPAVVHMEVQGVGYELQVSLQTFTQIQSLERGMLYTWVHIKEDAHVLYGFAEPGEKEVFLQLIGVSGVGAATARMMLSSLRTEELTRAIVQGNVKLLESIKGIGKKSAERLILELKDKLGRSSQNTIISSSTNNSFEQDALNALVALGIARQVAEQAVQQALTADPSISAVETLVKKALKLV